MYVCMYVCMYVHTYTISSVFTIMIHEQERAKEPCNSKVLVKFVVGSYKCFLVSKNASKFRGN